MSQRFHCAECAAQFATESEMLRHVSEPHVRVRGSSGEKERMATPPRGDRMTAETRRDREFSRRNPE